MTPRGRMGNDLRKNIDVVCDGGYSRVPVFFCHEIEMFSRPFHGCFDATPAGRRVNNSYVVIIFVAERSRRPGWCRRRPPRARRYRLDFRGFLR